MLESAATDIYLHCGFRRFLCVSRIEECIFPHLPNKYYQRLGIPLEEFRDQKDALIHLGRNGGWKGSLFEPATNQFGFRWSKQLYVGPDLDLLSKVPANAKDVLVLGSTSGKNEQRLKADARNVTAIPLDAVFGHRLSRLGIRVVDGDFHTAVQRLGSDRFDAILLPDLLHLVPNPASWLTTLKGLLSPGAVILFDVSNTAEVTERLKDRRAGRQPLGRSFKETGVQFVTSRRIRRWLTTAGLYRHEIESALAGENRHPLRRRGFTLWKSGLASHFLVCARVQ
jgi:SAM-dependent methyltransferase